MVCVQPERHWQTEPVRRDQVEIVLTGFVQLVAPQTSYISELVLPCVTGAIYNLASPQAKSNYHNHLQ